MSSKEPKKRIVGPYRSVHAAIWLVGLAILAIFNWWWPGILILVAISGLVEAYLRKNFPQSYEEESAAVAESPAEAAPTTTSPAPSSTDGSQPSPRPQEHRLELLPQVCPNCSGPIRGHEVKWTGAQSANCPYCGTNLPMSKG